VLAAYSSLIRYYIQVRVTCIALGTEDVLGVNDDNGDVQADHLQRHLNIYGHLVGNLGLAEAKLALEFDGWPVSPCRRLKGR